MARRGRDEGAESVHTARLQRALAACDWEAAHALALDVTKAEVEAVALGRLRHASDDERALIAHCCAVASAAPGLERNLLRGRRAPTAAEIDDVTRALPGMSAIAAAIAVTRLDAYRAPTEHEFIHMRDVVTAHRRAVLLDDRMPYALRVRAAYALADAEPDTVVQAHRVSPLPARARWIAIAAGGVVDGAEAEAVVTDFVRDEGEAAFLDTSWGAEVFHLPNAPGNDRAVDVCVGVLDRVVRSADMLVPWLLAQGPRGRLAVLVRLERLRPEHMAQVLRAVDVDEAYDAVAELWTKKQKLRPVLVWNNIMNVDERYLTLALSTMREDPVWSLQVMAVHQSPRALDELEGAVRALRAERIDVDKYLVMLPEEARARARLSEER